MKKFMAFLKWHYDSWSFSHKVYMLGAGFVGAGAADYWRTNEMNTAIKIGFSLWLLVIAKWFLWDTTMYSWKQFEKERKDLFRTIDEGK